MLKKLLYTISGADKEIKNLEERVELYYAKWTESLESEEEFFQESMNLKQKNADLLTDIEQLRSYVQDLENVQESLLQAYHSCVSGSQGQNQTEGTDTLA